MTDLRLVHNEPPTDPEPPPDRYQVALEELARSYWRRTAKPGSPIFDHLPEDSRRELLLYVEPFLVATVEAVITAGVIDRGDIEW